MTGPGSVSPLLWGSAAVSVAGAVTADVALGEHPTHSVVLGAVAVVVAFLSRRLLPGLVTALPAVAGALSVQPVLHLGAKAVRPESVPHGHANHLLHLLVDDGATAGVQIAVPALVLIAIAIGAHLAWLAVHAVRRRPPTAPPRPWVPARPVLVRVQSTPLGPVLRWCGWITASARRGPPAATHTAY